MNRRILLQALGLQAAAGLLMPSAAWAQAADIAGPTAQTPALAFHPIDPQNSLEQAFVSAFTHETMRNAFRHALITSQVALALANTTPESPPLFVDVASETAGAPPIHGGAVFTSPERLHGVLGPNAPFATLTGRQALERMRGRDVVLNYRLAPMLTLEADDVARYLDQPGGR